MTFKNYYVEEEDKTSSLFIPKVILCYAVPGAGKTTWIKKFNKDNEYIVISPDNIRKELTGDISNQMINKEVFDIARERLIKNIQQGKNVIIDATGVSKSQRDFFFNNLPIKVEMLIHVIDVNPEICKQRIKNDIKNGVDRSNVPMEVVDKFYNTFKQNLPLLDQEGFTRI